ncbi:BQ2448_7674 [Microbotryum intermedium]|uniref:ferric-chelate reductase (NADPH) n=1 Tax=Microbotryum intermedium TaxID=269621 RepID=A0A238FN93_9BASI|nr:BQ2448_7674 [Microbotryum intermedium]
MIASSSSSSTLVRVVRAGAQGAALLWRRHDTSSFTPAEKAEILIDPYNESPKYLATYPARIPSSLGRRVAANRFVSRFRAGVRWIACSQPRTIGWIRFPTTGTILLIASLWIFILVRSLSMRPYYRSRWNVGSPPLAIRTGLFALGVFPFILAFGAKWNWVTFVTGYSHEKLQVLHQWLSHLFLILSLLHTFPFVVAGREIRPNTDGKNPHLYSQIYYSGWVAHKVYYWSGVAALIPLAWLCWGSATPIRNRFYEIFKYLHFVSAILFSAFFYIHCNRVRFLLLGSWHYLWATAILYLSSVVMRFALLFVRNGIAMPKATVELLPESTVRVLIACPPGHRWKGGQHVFLNFIKAKPLESHPVTVANAPWLHPNAKAGARTMMILLRISPRSGLGPALLELASHGTSTPVLIDGPYGGLMTSDLGVNEHVVLLAGGSGVSFISSILQDLCERRARKFEGIRTKKVEVHWAVKNDEARAWLDDHFVSVVALVPDDFVRIHFYVTKSAIIQDVVEATAAAVAVVEEKPNAQESLTSKGSITSAYILKHSQQPLSSTPQPWFATHRGRPDLPAVLEKAFTSCSTTEAVGIASCGPAEFTTAVRNAVAHRQKQILLGASTGAQEVELHTEEFDW